MSNDSSIVEWLRPFVKTNAWDYVVVWKYGEDPTSFIEWIGCCCRGSCSVNIDDVVKPEEAVGELCHMGLICRDNHFQFQHKVKTKACEALAQLPFALPLSSGVHGEVAISQQSRWLTQDPIGTQVLIPIFGGLIELFTEKLIPMDINILEFITAHSCVYLKQEAIPAQSYTTENISAQLPSREQYSQWWPPHMSTIAPSVHQQCWYSSHTSIVGPSIGSNPSTEEPSFDSKFACLIPHECMKQLVKISPIPKSKTPKCNKTSGKEKRDLNSHCSKGEENKPKLINQPQKEGFQAKNLVTERNRRNKIKRGLFTLRSLVPKITKMDRAAILADAVDYIKELRTQEKELKDEIRTLEVQACEKNTSQLRIPLGKEQEGTRSSVVNQRSSDCTKTTHMKVEVHHISKTCFVIKLYCEQKQGGFSKLIEAIHSIGLKVASANMTTFDGKVLNILTVEATKQDIHPTKLRQYLMQKTSDDSTK